MGDCVGNNANSIFMFRRVALHYTAFVDFGRLFRKAVRGGNIPPFQIRPSVGHVSLAGTPLILRFRYVNPKRRENHLMTIQRKLKNLKTAKPGLISRCLYNVVFHRRTPGGELSRNSRQELRN
jgi:hypothetical protein